MSSHDLFSQSVRALSEARFKEYEREMLRQKAFAERANRLNENREKRRREFLSSIGTDLKKLDQAVEQDNKSEEAALQSFLKEFRGEVANRRPSRATDAKDAAIQTQVLSEGGHLVLPVFASSIFASDIGQFKDISGLDWTNGEINSGWVFPDDPSLIRIKDTRHYPNALCWDNRWDSPPEFAVHFTFVPATTATYEMTAILAFHGFYVLRSDDSWWNCRDAEVILDVKINVHQYVNTSWKDFPLLDVESQNIDTVTSYDRTHFMDYTAGLRAGDPVVVTVQGTVKATAHGAGAYAELNFADGTANYIQPLFLSVLQV